MVHNVLLVSYHNILILSPILVKIAQLGNILIELVESVLVVRHIDACLSIFLYL
jgi:hypothetical protein